MTTRKELFEIDMPGDIRDDDLPKVQGDVSSTGSLNVELPPGTVVFSVEQLTVLATAVLILVVIAFLVGSYVSNKVDTSSEDMPRPQVNVVEASEALLPDEQGQPPLPEEYSRPQQQQPAPAGDATANAPDGRYTLEVIRYIVEDRAIAMLTVEKLQRYGYAPVFLQEAAGGYSVCVGRFTARNNQKGLLWREELRALHSAYRHCEFVTVKTAR